MVIHQEGLDGGAAPLGAPLQVVGAEGIGQRFRSQLRQQRVRLGRFTGPQQGTEAARIVEPQQLAIFQLDIHMVMFLGRGADIQHP